MAYLRFKIKLDEWLENGILVATISEDGDEFPFIDNDLISVMLQFMLIEVGPLDYEEEISEATWIAELVPDVEEVDNRTLTKVTRLVDNSTHTLQWEVDRDNILVAHWIEKDGPEFPFNLFEKVAMTMRVTNVKQDPHGESYKSFPLWTALLVPEGNVVGDTIISEVKHKN